jgi:hypothetical protein
MNDVSYFPQIHWTESPFCLKTETEPTTETMPFYYETYMMNTGQTHKPVIRDNTHARVSMGTVRA